VRLWRTSRPEAVIAVITAIATLISAPQLQWGVLVGFILSLSYFMYGRAHPRIIEVGVHEDGTLRDRARFSLGALAPDVLAVRMDAALSFVTATPLEHFIMTRVRADASIKRVLIYAGPINSIDTTGVDTLSYLVGNLREQGVEVYLAGLKKQVEDVLVASGAMKVITPSNLFRTEREAIHSLVLPAGVAAQGH